MSECLKIITHFNDKKGQFLTKYFGNHQICATTIFEIHQRCHKFDWQHFVLYRILMENKRKKMLLCTHFDNVLGKPLSRPLRNLMTHSLTLNYGYFL